MSRRSRMRSMRGARSHTHTAFIELDRHACQACWECIDTCPNGVLSKLDFFIHRHAQVRHAELCKGCARCVRACPSDAIHYTYVPPSRRAATDGAAVPSPTEVLLPPAR